VDDFAIKKRHTYGTIMIDSKTHRVVDILPSREREDVSEWLKEYKNLEVVSRDGSATYAAAIRSANPEILQVSDRFHLLKGLSEACKSHIMYLFKANIKIAKSNSQSEEGSAYNSSYWKKDAKEDYVTRTHQKNCEKREKDMTEIRELAKEGYSISTIARKTNHSWSTVKRYVDPEYDPCGANYDKKYPSKLKPYEKTIKDMIEKGRKFQEIEEEIRREGYTGASSTIRMYATRERKLLKHAGGSFDETEIIERKWLINLLYRPMEKIKGINEEQVKQVIQENPVIGEIYDLVKSFREILFSKKADDIDNWLEEAGRLGIEEINSFSNGLRRDLEAVKNAVRYAFNNGLAEGSVNKLKLSKRLMYGRCGFDTLRKKLLLREQYKIQQT